LCLYKRKLQKYGIKLFVNPDGFEFRRERYNAFVRFYWKISEKYSVKSADLVICDSRHIQEHIERQYSCFNPQMRFIAAKTV